MRLILLLEAMLLVVQRIVLPAEGFHVHSEAFRSLPGTSPQYNSCTRFPLGALLSVCHFVAYGYIAILLRFYIMSWFYYSEKLSAFRFCVSFARITQNERVMPVFFHASLYSEQLKGFRPVWLLGTCGKHR